MANFETGKDILTNVLTRADELGIGLSDRQTEAQIYVQTAYISVLTEGYPWNFAQKSPPGALVTQAQITAGGVTTTQGSTTITFDTPPTISVAGFKFFIDANAVIYRILSHVANQANATIDAPFIDQSQGPGAAYHVFQDEYTLASDFLRPTSRLFLRRMDGFGICRIISREKFDNILAAKILWAGTDVPIYCCFIGDQTIRLHPWTTVAKKFEYQYIYNPGQLIFDGSSQDQLIIQPKEDRVVVALMATGNLLVDKNDDRASIFLDAATAKLSAMKRLALSRSRAQVWVAPGSNVGTMR